METVCSLDQLWFGLQGIGAILVAGSAILGLVVAFQQVNALKATREDASSIARAQRTTELLAEFGTEDMEYRFGFFDTAYNVSDSREVFNQLFDDFVVSSRRKLRAMDRASRLARVREDMEAYIDAELDVDDDTKVGKADRAQFCKNEIISVANLCERARVLAKRAVIDLDLLLDDQAYNIASVYFIAQDALADLCREEHFNFDDFREIALVARDNLKGKPYGKDLANQDFPPLPEYNPTP